MSTSSRSSTDDSSLDIEEMLHIEARCRELRREKDLLRETQSQSFDLIKRLELHVRKLNEARLEDKRQIQELKKELNNCHQEIEYLQGELNIRNADISYLEERVVSFEMKMADFDLLQEEVVNLREELKKSNTGCDFLFHELSNKEMQLEESRLQIEKLEESIASSTLEYQCEIESLRLETMGLDRSGFETKKSQENYSQKYENYMGHGDKISLEQLVEELKEELRKEKLRAKEEAEDLTQEMAELRYHLTELLEEERKRRAYVEQASIQRISELEALLKEKRESHCPVQSICEA